MTTGRDIAFFDIPYHSRLVTTLPIVRALVERGHRVHAFTLEPYRELVAASGAAVVLQPPFGYEPPDCTVNLRTIDYSMEAVPALVERLRALRPALVVYTAKCLWAAIAAELCGLPTAVVHTNALWPRGAPVSEAVFAARWPGRSEAEIGRIEARDRAAWARCADRFAVTRTHTDDVLPGIPNCMNLRGDINLVYTSEQLQPRRAEFDASYHFVGPCYDERSADDDPAFSAALAALPRPLIYASLGSMRLYNDRRDIFRTVFEALADGRYGAVVAVGAADTSALAPPPPHTLVRPYVPQLAVLQRASVFITHAGSNSVFESLLAGVPMLMLPQGADQPIFA
jgi:MGT family glycosyltransferase